MDDITRIHQTRVLWQQDQPKRPAKKRVKSVILDGIWMDAKGAVNMWKTAAS
jgi:hypothetical protein